jgi:ABC-type antimicrobial peptide transport system permease subunit
MIRNFFTVAYRHLVGNRVYSGINIIGLAAGMTVALLIGLWIQDETFFNKSVANYDRLGKVWQFVKFGPVKSSYDVTPQPLAAELREKYPEVESSSMNVDKEMIFRSANRPLAIQGHFVEPVFPTMFSLQMLAGSRNSLNEVHSVMLAQSAAKAFFGDKNPIGSVLRMGDSTPVKVTGIFADFPSNSDFKNLHFLAPWALFQTIDENAKKSTDQWDNNSFNIYVLLKPGVDFKSFSAKIRYIRMKRSDPPAYKPEFFVHPISRWHLYSEFYDGKNTGGSITFVWIFGMIGIFVLLLACINFVNLSTARSEKRSKEVGIRKTIGSVRAQLILQFFAESLLYVLCSFLVALLLVFLLLPYFNRIAGKEMVIDWASPSFWMLAAGFCVFTALTAGSYPAFYLSGFDAVQVLKGTFRAGRLAAIPRKAMVVLQFTVSVFMIIGTVVVFRRIQFIKDRPV